MRQILVAGNWKLNGSRESTKQLIEGIKEGMSQVKNAEVAVCPPYIYLPQVAELLQDSPIKWGGQNMCSHESGAYTGEISAQMLIDFSCKYVIIGHSERRTIYTESDHDIAKKFVAATDAGLIPILCVGELLEQRESGQTEDVVAQQIKAVLNLAGIEKFAKSVIAYEPVWAIGTGKTATSGQAQDVHKFIRTILHNENAEIAQNTQILYGGSVKPENAKELFAQEDIDGGLIGGASLTADSFLGICTAANEG